MKLIVFADLHYFGGDLETALFNTPQVVGYITNPVTYWLAKRIVKIKFISLGNLIVNRLAFKEFIQNDCNADALVNEIRDLIENPERRSAMLDEYAEIRKALGGSGASAAVAKAMLNELNAYSFAKNLRADSDNS